MSYGSSKIIMYLWTQIPYKKIHFTQTSSKQAARFACIISSRLYIHNKIYQNQQILFDMLNKQNTKHNVVLRHQISVIYNKL